MDDGSVCASVVSDALEQNAAVLKDSDLLAQICAGNKEATAVIFNKYATRLKAYAVRICGQKDADDIVQETFLKLIVNPPVTLAYDSLAPWMFKVARNLALDKLRKDRRIVDAEPPERLYEMSPHKLAVIHSEAALAKTLLSRLSDDYREVMELYAIAELSVKEIAGILDAPVGTILWRMHKARQLLEVERAKL